MKADPNFLPDKRKWAPMKAYTFCKAERDGHVLIVTINRPEVMNALHRPANLEPDQNLQRIRRRSDVVAGDPDRRRRQGLLRRQRSQVPSAGQRRHGCAGRLWGHHRTLRSQQSRLLRRSTGLPWGGGFEIALACDLIIASEKAVFALPEPRVGMAAMAGGLLRLPRQVPLKQAMSMILTGRRVSAVQGLTFGFVNEVVPHDQALEAAKRWAAEIIEGSPMSLRASKEVVYRGLDGDSPAAAYREQRMHPAVKGAPGD